MALTLCAIAADTGVNPMMTVEAIAYMVAEGISMRWKGQAQPSEPLPLPDALCTRLLRAANATTATKHSEGLNPQPNPTRATPVCKTRSSVEVSYE